MQQPKLEESRRYLTALVLWNRMSLVAFNCCAHEWVGRHESRGGEVKRQSPWRVWRRCAALQALALVMGKLQSLEKCSCPGACWLGARRWPSSEMCSLQAPGGIGHTGGEGGGRLEGERIGAGKVELGETLLRKRVPGEACLWPDASAGTS